MKPITSSSRRFRAAAAATVVAAVAASTALTSLSASAADPTGTVTAFSPEAGAVLNGGLISWQNEILATKAVPGGFTAFNASTGVAAASPLTPTGVAKSPVVFNGLLTWIDSTANQIRTANPGGSIVALTGSVPAADSILAVGTQLWVSKPGGIDRYSPSASALGGATALTGPWAATSVLRMTIGPDNNVWVIEKSTGVDTLTRFTQAGAVVGSTYNFTNSAADPIALATGPDAAVWIIEGGTGLVSRFDTNLLLNNYPLPAGANANAIAAGPDGGVWITENALNNVSRLSFTANTFTRVAYPAPSAFGLQNLILGPDQNMWAVGTVANKVAKFGTTAPTTTTTTTTTIAATTTTIAATTTKPPVATTLAPAPTLAPTTIAAVPTSVKGGILYKCVKTQRKTVKVKGKKVLRTTCVKYARA
jgi:hypothetical protein